MSFESRLKSDGIVDASKVTVEADYYGTGYVPRDFDKEPIGLNIPKFTGKVYDRAEWPELIKMHEKNKSRPLDWHLDGVKIKDQKNTNFCWAFGTVSGIETQYAKAGHNDLGLSPASTACLIHNFKNEGGWGTWACKGVNDYGIATYDKWPNVSFDRTLPHRWDVRANMEQHDLHDFEDLGRENLDAVVSVLLDEHNPAPVTGGFMWWGHLVLLLGVVEVGDGEYGIVFANSWGADWGDSDGYGVLTGSKMIPYEAVRVGAVKPRSLN